MRPEDDASTRSVPRCGHSSTFQRVGAVTGGLVRLLRTRPAIWGCSSRPKGRSLPRNDPVSGECRLKTKDTHSRIAFSSIASKTGIRLSELSDREAREMFRASLFGLVVIVFFSISAMAQVPELPSPGQEEIARVGTDAQCGGISRAYYDLGVAGLRTSADKKDISSPIAGSEIPQAPAALPRSQ